MISEIGAPAGALLFGALMVELVILFNARMIAKKLEIMDHPDFFRKTHSQATPLVGGIAIIIPILLWALGMLALGQIADERFTIVMLLCGAGATLVGYTDDQSATSPSSRLLFLFLLSAFALVLAPSLVPAQLNWGSFAPTPLAHWFAFALMAVSMAGYVNAVNMADGQNGVVTGMFVIWAACLMIVTRGLDFAAAEVLFETTFVAFAFNLAGRVFLGDSGTYGVTFVFGLLAINAHNYWGVSAETIAVWFFIPVIDCLRLMITRLLRGRAPSDGDRTHFHHRLQDHFGKNRGLTIYLSAVGATSVIASLTPRLSLWCMVFLAAIYFRFAWLAETQLADERGDEADAGDELQLRTGTDKVVSLDAKDKHVGR